MIDVIIGSRLTLPVRQGVERRPIGIRLKRNRRLRRVNTSFAAWYLVYNDVVCNGVRRDGMCEISFSREKTIHPVDEADQNLVE